MKKFIVLSTLPAVLLGAWLFKPRDPRSDLTRYLLSHGYGQGEADHVASQFVYEDRIFWVDAVQFGAVGYSNILNHWVERNLEGVAYGASTTARIEAQVQEDIYGKPAPRPGEMRGMTVPAQPQYAPAPDPAVKPDGNYERSPRTGTPMPPSAPPAAGPSGVPTLPPASAVESSKRP